MNIAQLISWRAAERPEAIALEDAGGQYTYAMLDRSVAHAAHHLARAGVTPGMLVATGMLPSGGHLIVLLALARLGAASMPITPGEAQGKRDGVAERFRPAFLVSLREKNGVAGVPFLLVEPQWFLPPDSFQAAPPAPGGDAHWRVNLTSGTTGVARGAAWTHAATLGAFEDHHAFFPLPPGSR